MLDRAGTHSTFSVCLLMLICCTNEYVAC